MEETEKKVGLFDFLNSISFTKENLLTPETEKEYNPYMINRFLSAEVDTVLIANEINAIPGITKKMHYDFLRLLIPPRKRYFKYLKPEKLENEEMVRKYFGYSREKAKEAMAILTEEDYAKIRKSFETGGVEGETNSGSRRSRKES